jgi:hypothetical protein
MKRGVFIVMLLAATIAELGCQKPQNTPSDGIGEGIRQHLRSLNTLNLSAMDMNIIHVDVNGDAAQALVEYVPKTGAPSGAAMRVSYSLEKRKEQWVVVKTNSLGGAIDHPAPGTSPHAQTGQGEVHGTLPNLRELIPSSATDAHGALPPGHPPVTPSESPKHN